MKLRGNNVFSTVRTYGAVLPADLLQRIALGHSDFDGFTPAAYHLLEGEKLNEVTNRSWNRLRGAWVSFKGAVAKLPSNDLCMFMQHYTMLSRNLLYTALTRAKQLAILVGPKKAIGLAVRQVKDQQRYTLLAQRLKNA